MIYKLDNKEIWFPDPSLADEEGLLAWGGDLSPERLLLAYSNGIFPWYSAQDEPILWWCPKKRFVIFPNEIHISHSMERILKSERYAITFNRDFPSVIRHCSKVDNRSKHEGAWLLKDMINAYTEFHKLGYVSRVEVWDTSREDSPLVGGLYGVTLGKCFFGESMFSLAPNGSKIALIGLALHMQKAGGNLIDCQLHTPHLESMGGKFISYEEYMKLVKE